MRPAASRPAPADAEALPTRARPTPGSAQVPGGSTMVCTRSPATHRAPHRAHGGGVPVGEDVRPASSGRDGAVPGGPAALRRVSGDRSRPAIAGLPAGVREGTVRGVPGLRSGPAGLPARAGRAVRGRDGGVAFNERRSCAPRVAAAARRRWPRSCWSTGWSRTSRCGSGCCRCPWSLGYQMAFAAALCRDVLAVHPGRVRLVGAPGGAPRDGDSLCGAVTVIRRFGGAQKSERALPLPGARRRVHTIAADGGAGLSRAARADRRRGGGRAGWFACHARERLHWPRSRGGLS